MTDPATPPPRPRQVTLAAWLIILGSVVVVLTVFERIAGLQSLETQDAVERFLAEPPGADLGLGVQGVLDVLRTLAMVAGGCATAAAILGYQVLRRNRAARVGLSVLALPLFVSGMATGGFMSSIVVAAAVMLWFQPARDWFNGIAREPRPEPERPAAAQQSAPTSPVETGPRAYPGFGSAPSPGPAGGFSAPVAPHPAYAPQGQVTRPTTVLWACVLTWVFASLAVLVMASSIAVLATSPDLVFDEIRKNPDLVDQGVSDAMLVQATYVVGGVMIAWGLVAIALATLTFRRRAWARLPLAVSAGISSGLCLVATLGQPLMILPLCASVATLALLVRDDTKAWLTRP
ncbi:hypothetical protein H5V45_13650 [Nocardioides sp. KIGAM211]|uniref:DUF4064 domain-containing protein n=1 Tax=Nocardioides luti TaxID=2761101 RepID=A0A7X0RHE0_9ACTN|nr:hypothetical protein [Nocardioides luti]MBB6628366.1 hypothetical protein [Nocardioides luti]